MLTNRQRLNVLKNMNSNKSRSSEDSFRVTEEGDYRLRILPDPKNTEDNPSEYYRQVSMHFNQKIWEHPYTCPRGTHVDYEYEMGVPKNPIRLGEKCPICSIYFQLLGTGLPEDAQVAAAIRPSYRFIFNIVVLSHPDLTVDGKSFKYDPDRVYVFNTAPSSVKTGGRNLIGGLDQLWEETLDNGEYKYPDLIDYDEGIIINVRRTGKGMMNTRYAVSAPETSTDKYISDPRPESEWREKSFSLSDFITNELASKEEELLEAANKFLKQGESEEITPESKPKSAAKKETNASEKLGEYSAEELDALLSNMSK